MSNIKNNIYLYIMQAYDRAFHLREQGSSPEVIRSYGRRITYKMLMVADTLQSENKIKSAALLRAAAFYWHHNIVSGHADLYEILEKEIA